MQRKVFVLVVFFQLFLHAQTGFSMGLGTTFTVQSKSLPYPNNVSAEFYTKSFSYSSIFAPTLWLNYAFNDDVSIEVAVEYLTQSNEETFITVVTEAKTKQFKSKEGFHLVPIDFSAAYKLPFSTETFSVIMSGGLGVYYGKIIRELGSLYFNTEEGEWSAGLQVALGLEYEFIENFPLSFKMKFREPTLWMKGNFNSDSGFVQGNPFLLGTTRGESRLISDGLVFMLGFSTTLGE